MRRHAILPGVLALLAACGDEAPEIAPASPAPAARMQDQAQDSEMKATAPIVVMLGDSLTAGYQLTSGDALPAIVQRELDAAGVAAKLVNAGVSGDMTADGLNRYDWSVTGSGADLLVVALGANDFLNGLSPEIPRRNLAAILARAQDDNIPAALVGVKIPESGAPSEREQAFAAIYPELAAEFGVPLLPDMLAPVAGKPGLLMADGVHPTAEGVEAMAGALASFLAPVVGELE